MKADIHPKYVETAIVCACGVLLVIVSGSVVMRRRT